MIDVVTLVKDVPNPAGTPPEIGEDHRLRRQEPAGGLDPADEPGLAVATDLIARDGGSVTAVCMGAGQATRSLRRALALGADHAVLVADDSLPGADALVTARVLALAIATVPYDLVLAGVESADGATGAVPGAVAELLGLPAVTFARRVEIDGGRVTAERQTASGYDVVTCELPALVTLTGAAAEPRHPSVRATMDARKKQIETLSPEQLGLELDELRSTHRVTAVEIAPERPAGDLVDAAAGPDRIVELLAAAEALG